MGLRFAFRGAAVALSLAISVKVSSAYALPEAFTSATLINAQNGVELKTFAVPPMHAPDKVVRIDLTSLPQNPNFPADGSVPLVIRLNNSNEVGSSRISHISYGIKQNGIKLAGGNAKNRNIPTEAQRPAALNSPLKVGHYRIDLTAHLKEPFRENNKSINKLSNYFFVDLIPAYTPPPPPLPLPEINSVRVYQAKANAPFGEPKKLIRHPENLERQDIIICRRPGAGMADVILGIETSSFGGVAYTQNVQAVRIDSVTQSGSVIRTLGYAQPTTNGLYDYSFGLVRPENNVRLKIVPLNGGYPLHIHLHVSINTNQSECR